jgi:transposase-like protein
MGARWLDGPEEVKAEATAERLQAAPKEEFRDGEIKTMDDIIRELEVVDTQLNRSVRCVRDADEIRGEAAAALRRAAAKARLAARAEKGTVPEKDAMVTMAVDEEQTAADVAEVAYRYARETGAWLEGRKSSLQTQSKLVLATYQLAGSNRREA